MGVTLLHVIHSAYYGNRSANASNIDIRAESRRGRLGTRISPKVP
jgi:hypothetical protein